MIDWSFFLALIALCVAACLVRDQRMGWTAFVLSANWAVNTAVVHLSGDPYPWEAFGQVDMLSTAALLFIVRPNVWQSLIGFLYATQLAGHALTGWANDMAVTYYGWQFLGYIAWAQIVAVAVWLIVENPPTFDGREAWT